MTALTIVFYFLPVLIGLTIFGVLNKWNSAFVVQILHEMSLCVLPDRRIIHPVYDPTWETPAATVVLMDTTPEGWEGLIGTFFNQLPEQIREHWHYRNVYAFGDTRLGETRAIVESYPGGDRDEVHTDYWEKTSDGWVLTRSEVPEGGSPW
jgi:hypothetical protein